MMKLKILGCQKRCRYIQYSSICAGTATWSHEGSKKISLDTGNLKFHVESAQRESIECSESSQKHLDHTC
jgi:hypothetical protein